MKRLALKMSATLTAVTLVTLLSACGNSGGSAPVTTINPPGGSNPPPTIEGVATPSSVSVVTATNAN